MDLSIIIVNYNVYEDVKVCIRSIYEFHKNSSFEIIVVDNNSKDRSVYDITKDFPEVVFVPLDTNHGFGHANNVAMGQAKGDYLLLVNPDIVFQDNAIAQMLNYLKEDKTAGVAGPIQYKPGVGIEYYYTFFPTLYSRVMQEWGFYVKAGKMKARTFDFLDSNIETGKPFYVNWIIGSCMMVKREIYDKTGGFDEAFFLYEEETEWQYRMSLLGWKSAMIPTARVVHNHHSSSSKFGLIFIRYQEFRSRIIFSSKHDSILKKLIRKPMISLALLLRILRSFLKKEYRLFDGGSVARLYMGLLLLNWKTRNGVLKDRFDPIRNLGLFKPA